MRGNNVKTVRCSEIVYDTDGQEVDLPSTLTVEIDCDAGLEETLADLISDRTGFCVISLNYQAYCPDCDNADPTCMPGLDCDTCGGSGWVS